VMEKVDSVRGNVKAVMNMIEGTKEKQLEERLMRADAEKAAEEEATGAVLDWSRSHEFEEEESDEEEELDEEGGRYMQCLAIDGDISLDEVDSCSLEEMGLTPKDTPNADKELDEIYGAPETSSDVNRSSVPSVDFTRIPKILDAAIEKFDKDSTLRSTKIKTNDTWSRKRQPDLLTKPSISTLRASDVKSESNKAYDLLDAISRSGSLPIAYSDLHVVICVTHCFEKDIMATVVEDNINPIKRLEMATLLLGSTIHGERPANLIVEESDRGRFAPSFLMLETGK